METFANPRYLLGLLGVKPRRFEPLTSAIVALVTILPRLLQRLTRADERTRTADLISLRVSSFPRAEQPAPRFLSLRPVYWTVTNVKVGTNCVSVLSNSRIYPPP